MFETLSDREYIALAKKKMDRVLDHAINLAALHENNAIVVFSPILAKQIPQSYAAHAFPCQDRAGTVRQCYGASCQRDIAQPSSGWDMRVTYRGFESHPLRQQPLITNEFLVIPQHAPQIAPHGHRAP